MSDRVEGVLVGNSDEAYFIPGDRLAEFKIDSGVAEAIAAESGEGEVQGFARRPLRPKVKPLSFGFSGPIMRPGPMQSTYSLAPTAT